MKRLRLFLATATLASAFIVVGSAPAQACINPDEPTCPIVNTVCSTKYRDRIPVC